MGDSDRLATFGYLVRELGQAPHRLRLCARGAGRGPHRPAAQGRRSAASGSPTSASTRPRPRRRSPPAKPMPSPSARRSSPTRTWRAGSRSMRRSTVEQRDVLLGGPGGLHRLSGGGVGWVVSGEWRANGEWPIANGRYPIRHSLFAIRETVLGLPPAFAGVDPTYASKPALRASSMSGTCGRAPMCEMTSAAARLPSLPAVSSGMSLATPNRKPAA